MGSGAQPATIGGAAIQNLDDVPLDTVLQMASERGHGGLWLERVDATNVTVHLVQVKGGQRAEDASLPCGKSPTSSNDTLVTVIYRLLTRSWPDIKTLLGPAAAASKCDLMLGKLVLRVMNQVVLVD